MSGLLLQSVLALIAGVLLNFTPCVLPVIPLKVRTLLNELDGTARARGFAAGALLSGSLVFFIVLGAFSAWLGWRWGTLFQSKLFLTLLSLMLLIAGLAMLLNWTFRLPQLFYAMPLHRYSGAFLTGVLAGILATPCAGPFLGSVLAYTLTQSPAVVIGLFAAIGVGLSLPYGLILLAPNAQRWFPKGGRIGHQVTMLLAFVLLAGAVFFAQPILPDTVIRLLWWLLGGVILIWALRAMVKNSSVSTRAIPVLTLAALIFSAQAGWFGADSRGLNWQPYSETALQQAQQTSRLVLIEFTADWCINCKVLERTVYASPMVEALAQETGLTVLKVDMTDFSDEQATLLDRYGGLALPHAVLLDMQGGVRQTFTGMFTLQSLLAAIADAGRLTVSSGTDHQ